MTNEEVLTAVNAVQFPETDGLDVVTLTVDREQFETYAAFKEAEECGYLVKGEAESWAQSVGFLQQLST